MGNIHIVLVEAISDLQGREIAVELAFRLILPLYYNYNCVIKVSLITRSIISKESINFNFYNKKLKLNFK